MLMSVAAGTRLDSESRFLRGPVTSMSVSTGRDGIATSLGGAPERGGAVVSMVDDGLGVAEGRGGRERITTEKGFESSTGRLTTGFF